MPQRQFVRRVALNVVIVLLLVLHTEAEADDNYYDNNHYHDNRQQPKSEVERRSRHDERQHVKGSNDG